MLNNIFCVPDEKDSPKHVLLFMFHIHVRKFWRGEKNTKFTANAALRMLPSYITTQMDKFC